MPWSEKKPFKNTSCHIKKNYYPTFPFSQYILISYVKLIQKWANFYTSQPLCVRPIKHANKSLWRPRLFLYNFFFLFYF